MVREQACSTFLLDKPFYSKLECFFYSNIAPLVIPQLSKFPCYSSTNFRKIRGRNLTETLFISLTISTLCFLFPCSNKLHLLLSFLILDNYQRTWQLSFLETSLFKGKHILHDSVGARENLLVNVEKEKEIRREERFRMEKEDALRPAKREKRTASESRKWQREEVEGAAASCEFAVRFASQNWRTGIALENSHWISALQTEKWIHSSILETYFFSRFEVESTLHTDALTRHLQNAKQQFLDNF